MEGIDVVGKWEDAGLLKGPTSQRKHVKPLVGNFIFLNVKNLTIIYLIASRHCLKLQRPLGLICKIKVLPS